MGIGLSFFTRPWTSSFLLWFQAFPHRVIPENPEKGVSFPSKNHGGSLSVAEYVGLRRSFQFNVWAQETREKEKACPPGAWRGKLHTPGGKGIRIRNPISAGCVPPRAGTGTERVFAGGRGGNRPPVCIQWDTAGRRCHGWNSLSSTTCPQKEDWNVPSASSAGSLSPKAQIVQRGLVGALGEPRDTGWPQGPVCSHLWLTHSGSSLLTWAPRGDSAVVVPHRHSHLTPLSAHFEVCEGEIRQGRGNAKRGFFQSQWSAHPSYLIFTVAIS